MKFHPIAIVGSLLILAGVATIFYPQVTLPARTHEVTIGANKAIISTHRVITFPLPFSIILIVCGAVQIFLTTKAYPTRG